MFNRVALTLLALPFALPACTSHSLEVPVPQPQMENDQYYEVQPVRDVDLLFLIDDSPSMANKQANLRQNFPAFMNELTRIPGGLPDVHIGVVTSDLGAGPTTVAQCYPGGKRGILRSVPSCPVDPGARFLVSTGGGTQNNFAGDIAQAFSCLADVGEAGCGFEHQLEAVRVALDQGLTPQNQGFLRPDAYLGIILLTDEDDCSAAPTSDLFTDDLTFAGTTPSFRCAQVGHLCNGAQPPVGPFSAPLESCQAAAQGRLLPVSDIIASLRALKAHPDEQIVVAAVSGWADDPATAAYRYGPALGADGRIASDALDYLPICYGTGVDGRPLSATAALRIKQFVDAFGTNGSFHQICASDYGPAMQLIGQKVASKFGNPCITAPLRDANLTQPGLQADCVVEDSTTAADGAVTTVPLPACASGQTPCWQVAPDASCPASGYRMQIQRAAAAPQAGIAESIKCLACADRSVPGCGS